MHGHLSIHGGGEGGGRGEGVSLTEAPRTETSLYSILLECILVFDKIQGIMI